MDDEPAKKRKSGGTPAWMLTFSDLAALMLTFFVLLFSMSSVQVDKWSKLVQTLSQRLNPTRERTFSAPSTQHNIGSIFRERAVNLRYLSAILEEKMAASEALSEARLIMGEDWLRLALPAHLLFEPGGAALRTDAGPALFALSGVLANVGNQVTVRGHTAPEPPPGDIYPSRWELSVARATAVANALRRAGYSRQVDAFGLADTRFDQLPADLPREERLQLARRVDLIILAERSGGG